MKAILLYVIVLVVSTSNVFAQWNLCPKVVSDPLYSLSIWDSMNIVASGGDGTIIRTKDGGVNWQIDSTFTRSAIHQIISINDKINVAFTRGDGIHKTNNSGKNWIKISNLDLGGDYLFELVDDGENSSVFYGVSNSTNSFYKSTDSCTTWQLVSVLPTQYELSCIKFIDNLNGYVCGNHGIILRTKDGGLTWEKISRGLTSHWIKEIAVAKDSIYLSGVENGSWKSAIYVGNLLSTEGFAPVKFIDPSVLTFSFSGKYWWISADKKCYFSNDLSSLDLGNNILFDKYVNSIKWLGKSGLGFLITEAGEVYKTINHGYTCNLTFTKNPIGKASVLNDSVSFSVNVNEIDAQFQWQSFTNDLSWVDVIDNSTYKGSNTNNLTIHKLRISNHGQMFRTIASYLGCKDTSEIASLTVLDTCIFKRTDTVKIAVSDTLIIKTKATGIQENKYYSFLIYPNPTNSYVIIDCGDPSEVSTYSFVITNSLGQEKVSSKFTSRYQQIDISGIGGAGLYIISIRDSNNTVIETRKLLIQ